MDIITQLYHQHGFNPAQIRKITFGALYVAVELQNGNIGVCATLKESITELPEQIDLNDFKHRVILQAYYNAMFNYDCAVDFQEDIFASIDFCEFKNTVMIGYFRPLAAKFFAQNIPITIFDLDDDSPEVSPIGNQNQSLRVCDALIMSATAITNQTYLEILSSVPPFCKVYVLGPSSIMHPDIFQFANIEAVFGSRFLSGDIRVHEAIAAGGGNKAFSGFAEKLGVRS